MKPRQFDDLAAFTARCERTLAAEGEEARIVMGYRRPVKRKTVTPVRGGPVATVIGWDAEAKTTLLEIGARDILRLIEAGHFEDRKDVSAVS